MDNITRLERQARQAKTIMDKEQERGRADLSVRQTRRMALSVAAAGRATGALTRARMSWGAVSVVNGAGDGQARDAERQDHAAPGPRALKTYGIGYEISNTKRPYYIVEDGTRLPIAFAPAEAALEQIRFLKADQTGTVPREECDEYDELVAFVRMLKRRARERERQAKTDT